MSEPLITDWHGCYDGNWNGLIVPEAFAHPAKYSYGLISRIIRHGMEQGYWQAGDTIGDCFGGIASGGVVAGYFGLNWLGVELEQRFVELGNRNLAMHGPRWMAAGDAVCVKLVQGDSRRFAEIVGEVCGVVTSPPYISGGHHTDVMGAWNENGGGHGVTKEDAGYGHTPGQIGSLKSGSLDAVVTSPPFASQMNQGGAGTTNIYRKWCEQNGRNPDGPNAQTQNASKQYGDAPGQIASLPSGQLDAVITSPPYAESVKGDHAERETAAESTAKRTTPGGSLGQSARHGGYGVTDGQIGALREGVVDGVVTSPPYSEGLGHGGEYKEVGAGGHKNKKGQVEGYGTSPGNVGNDSPDTYWKSMALVYRQVHQAIKPNGIAAIVLKDYIKAGKRVPLCDDTCRLLESIGFDVFERTRAWLVKEDRHPSLFGGDEVKLTERKSFFRRLCEKRGSPRIDMEEVLWCRKP